MIAGDAVRSAEGLDLVQSFVVVAEELSFRRAAERLHVDQSALTRRIQKLEHLVGFALFERTTRAVSLTEPGRLFHRENTALLHGYAAALAAARRVAQGRAGLLRIAYMSFAATTLMPRAVAAYRREHPAVDLALRYLPTQGQKIALANDEIDAGFMIGPFDHPDVAVVALDRDRLYVAMPIGHDLSCRDVVPPKDVEGVPVILGDSAEWEAYRTRLEDLFSAEGVRLDVQFEASNTLGLIGLVSAGLGITNIPGSLVGILGPLIEVRPIAHPHFMVETVLARRRKNRATATLDFAAMAKFIAEDAMAREIT